MGFKLYTHNNFNSCTIKGQKVASVLEKMSLYYSLCKYYLYVSIVPSTSVSLVSSRSAGI